MANVLPGDGRNVMQVFPLINIGSTSGADTIDVTGMHLLVFDTDVTIYINGVSSETFALPAMTPLGVTEVESLHVDAATNYLYT